MRAEKNYCGYCALIGRPNVGKSTLLNRLIGQKLAITSRKPQTTRHSIVGVKTVPEGQVIYVDTPGIHQRGTHAMNRYLNRTAKTTLMDVDLLLFVVEALTWTDEDTSVLNAVKDSAVTCILVVNKVDLIKDKARLLPFLADISSRHTFAEVIPLSAAKGDNLDRLEQQVIALLPESDNLFPDDQLTDRSERFFVAELIREQLTRRYAKEIPYALTVEIERFEEGQGRCRIGAVIWVERPGQKSIIIGKQGAALKEVASQARIEMEAFLQRRVYLDVWVKVKKSWSSDEHALSQLGYGD